MENKELLTIKEVAELLRLKQNVVYGMTYRKQIPFIKIGRTKRFSRSKIMAWINSNSYDTISPRK